MFEANQGPPNWETIGGGLAGLGGLATAVWGWWRNQKAESLKESTEQHKQLVDTIEAVSKENDRLRLRLEQAEKRIEDLYTLLNSYRTIWDSESKQGL